MLISPDDLYASTSANPVPATATLRPVVVVVEHAEALAIVAEEDSVGVEAVEAGLETEADEVVVEEVHEVGAAALSTVEASVISPARRQPSKAVVESNHPQHPILGS